MEKNIELHFKVSFYIIFLGLCSLSIVGCASTPQSAMNQLSIQGIVFDLDKSPVKGATITLNGKGRQHNAETDNRGRFTVHNIDPGSYEVTFEKQDFEKKNWTLKIIDAMDLLYLQVASFWQLLDAAAISLGKKSWGEARELLDRAISINSESPTLLFLQAKIEEEAKNIDTALALVARVIELDPGTAYAWLYLADLYGKAQDPSGEKRALEKFLSLKSDPIAQQRLEALQE